MKPNPRRVSMIEKPQVVKLKLPDYLREDLKIAYSLFATSESNGITLSQAKSILWNFGYWKLTESQFEQAMLENNINTSKGTISWEDLIAVVTKKYHSGGKNTKLQEIFQIFDKKGKGVAGVSDIHKVLKENLEFSVNDNEINEILEGARIGETGDVLFEQFATM